jgi:hypothetical protein
MKRFIQAYPNDKTTRGRRPYRYYNERGEVEEFIRQWDQPGWAVYECRNPLLDTAVGYGAAGRRVENVGVIAELYIDIDEKDLDDTKPNILATVEEVSCPATAVHDSGGGVHLFWRLETPIERDTADFFRAQKIHKDLVEVFCADPCVSHPAALVRALGTHNSKRGEPVLVERVGGSGRSVTLDHLEEMVLQLRGRARPMFVRKESGKANGAQANGSAPGEHKGPIDVDAALGSIAAGQRVHNNELSATSALLNSGMSVEMAVREVFAAAERASESWWDMLDEEDKLFGQCFDWIRKRPELAYLLPDELQQTFHEAVARGCTNIRIAKSRVTGKWEVRATGGAEDTRTEDGTVLPPLLGGFTFYDGCDIRPAAWTIKNILPESGIAIISGQWGLYKTALLCEMSYSITRGEPFAGRYKIKRQGAVMAYILEGGKESAKRRMRGIEETRGGSTTTPGIAWSETCPPLSHPNSAGEIIAAFRSVDANARAAYGMPVAVMFFDTYSMAAGHALSGDDSDRSATQKCFNTLRKVSKETGALVVVTDHFGKSQEAGTTGRPRRKAMPTPWSPVSPTARLVAS